MVQLQDGQPIINDGKVAQSVDCCCFPSGPPTTDCAVPTRVRVTIGGCSDGNNALVTGTGCCATIDGVYDLFVTSGVPASYFVAIPNCYGPYSSNGGFDPADNPPGSMNVGCDGDQCHVNRRWWVRITISSRCFDPTSCTSTLTVVYESTETQTDNVRGTFTLHLGTDFSCSSIHDYDCQWPSTITLRAF